MIFGKISPVAQIIKQKSPFEQETIVAEYIAAIARPYTLGTTKVNFQVTYGNLKKDEAGNIVAFDTVYNDNVFLEGAVIADWGTDDATMLEHIAEVQGTEVTEIVTANLNVF